MNIKRLTIILLLLLMLSSLPAAAQDDIQTLTIGMIVQPERLGDQSFSAAQQGAELAIEEINDAGGIEGQDDTQYRLRLIVREAANAAEVSTILTEFEASGVTLVLGPDLNGLVPVNRTDHLPLLVSASGSEFGTSPLIYQMRANDATLAEAAAYFAVDELDADQIAVVTARAGYGYAVEDTIHTFLADADPVEVVLSMSHDADSTALDDIAARIAVENPDTLIVWNTAPSALALLASLEAQGWQGDVVYGNPSTAFLENVPTLESITLYGVLPWSSVIDQRQSRDFVELYQDEYGQMPLVVSAIYYDTVYLIQEGIEQHSGDRADLADWLEEEVQYEGVQGNYGERHTTGEMIRSAVVLELDGSRADEAARYDLGEVDSDTSDVVDTSTDTDDDADEEVRVRTENSNLNLRAAPNAEASVLGVIPPNSELTAFARNTSDPEQTWIAVTYEGQDGWVVESALFTIEGSLDTLPESSRTFALSS
ncbi:MAG: hypothetical protein OHK0046_03990 [Anaerolineae bacterium]